MPAPFDQRLVQKLQDKEYRDAYAADVVRVGIARQIRALREQAGREWSQAELGRRMGKPQSVVSRLEDPDYGRVTLQTLFEVAAAFELPLWVEIADWADFLERASHVLPERLERSSFDADRLAEAARASSQASAASSSIIISLPTDRTAVAAPTGASASTSSLKARQAHLPEQEVAASVFLDAALRRASAAMRADFRLLLSGELLGQPAVEAIPVDPDRQEPIDGPEPSADSRVTQSAALQPYGEVRVWLLSAESEQPVEAGAATRDAATLGHVIVVGGDGTSLDQHGERSMSASLGSAQPHRLAPVGQPVTTH